MNRHLSVPIILVSALLGIGTFGWAQEQNQTIPPPEQQAQAQPVPQQVLSADQLDNLVAPIALYPDPLLGQMLVASTYPLELVEASQWLQRHPDLKGQALVDAAKQQPWDPSIQALVAVPDALATLNQDIRWTTDLGNAFLSQQADVMSAVQRMRARAEEKGRLSSTPQQTVTTQEEGGQQVIVIQPASPQVIYVPVYDPAYIWGPPVYGYYPPLYYPTFGFGFGLGFNLGFCFDGWGGWGFWGWGPSWFGHTVFINNYFFHHYGYHQYYGAPFRGETAWIHDPVHRMRVPYANARVAERFGAQPMVPRNPVRTGSGPRGAVGPSIDRSGGQFARSRSAGTPAYRATPSPAARTLNPPRQQYQYSRQYQSPSRQGAVSPQIQRSQSQSPERYLNPRTTRSNTQQYRSSPRIVPFGNQTQRTYQAPQQYRYSGPQYRSFPQAQQFQSLPQQRFQAPQLYRSAPRMSAPHFGGGGFSRGNNGSISRGRGTTFSRGGGGARGGGRPR
jgi:hypothetical protein